MEKYELVKDIGSGNFGVARLMRNKETKELVAMKYIDRGLKVPSLFLPSFAFRCLYIYIYIWICRLMRTLPEKSSTTDHSATPTSSDSERLLSVLLKPFPNRINQKFTPIQNLQVVLTPTHLAIVMEYAAGGELFERICNAGRFSEDEARYFFQQLISGVSYCHSLARSPLHSLFLPLPQICHRDLKLENTLLDGSPAPRLKICDFGYSKSSLLHSRPKSTVGTPAYIAPEVLSRREYDGKLADVWSCGVTLYVMLVGAYPFEDQEDPKNFRKTINRIMAVQYKIPDYVHISQDCRHLLSRIFVANPARRITIKEIKNQPWFLKNLPRELTEAAQTMYYRKENPTFSLQSVENIMKIVEEAKNPPPVSRSVGGFGWGGEEDGDAEDEVEQGEDEEDEYEKRVKEAHQSGEVRVV
ncbi:hypothetical protein ACLB2K_050498 [Fragaria x ananassa]